MLAGARARLAGDPALAERLELVRGQAEQLPFADGEFDALTFTYLLRYVDDRAATMRELARVVRPGGRIGMLEFGVPQAEPPQDRSGGRTPESACRSWAERCPPRGTRSGSSSGRASRATRAPGARPGGAVALGRDPQRPRAPDELRRGTAHVGHEGWRQPRVRLRSPRVLRAAVRRLARPRHDPAPAVHAVAPQLRRARRGRSPDRARQPPRRRAGRVLPRGRPELPRPRRAHGPPAEGPPSAAAG